MSAATEKDSSFRPIVGIDLGTTNSAAAYIFKQKAKMISVKNDENMIPSVVLINPKGKVVVGEEAKNALVAMPERTKAAVKRSMGENIIFPLGDQSYTPEELSAFILKEIKESFDKELGEGEKEAVITVPAYFTNAQRQATKRAGELAGFVVERIINEPTAASLAYGLQNLNKDSHILVYDLGGGTFDVSVVEIMGGIIEVKASAGNNQLGGEDFDWLLVDWLSERVIAEHDVDPRLDVRAKARLKEEAEKVKKLLSYESWVEVAIPVITMKNDTPIGLDVTVTREEFISLINPLLQETEEKLMEVVQEANLAAEEIDEVLLVGGSTRIPQVRELVTKFFKRKPKSGINPDEVVALGAAVQAGIKSGALSNKGIIVTDVAPFSMGISVLNHRKKGFGKPGAFHAIIPRNTTIPVTRTEQFTTSVPNQTSVKIEIYQGENDWVKDNYFLNEFLLEGLPPKPAGEEGVDVTFRYNLNGILEVSAKSITTGLEMKVTLEDALDRSSETAFYDSLVKVESAYNESGDDDNEDLDLFNFMDYDEEENDHKEETETVEELMKEAEDWKKRFEKELKNRDGTVEEQITQFLAQLKKAMEERDTILLHEAIENGIDLAIDLEM